MDDYIYQCPLCGSMEFSKDRKDSVAFAGSLCFLLGFLGLFTSPILGGIGIILAIVIPFSHPN